jgi:hypothetical protein
MQTLKTLVVAALSSGFVIAASSVALAKAHDQGVADGTRTDPSALRGGGVAGLGVPGIGNPATTDLCQADTFCGVAADLDQDLNYGQDIVQDQVANDTRRVHPIDRPGLNK